MYGIHILFPVTSVSYDPAPHKQCDAPYMTWENYIIIHFFICIYTLYKQQKKTTVMKCSNHVIQSLTVTGFKRNIYCYKSVTENSVLVGYDTGSHRMESSTTLLWKFKTCTSVPVPSHAYSGLRAAVVDINKKLQFVRFE